MRSIDFQGRMVAECVMSPIAIIMIFLFLGMLTDALFQGEFFQLQRLSAAQIIGIPGLLFGLALAAYRPVTIVDLEQRVFLRRGVFTRSLAFEDTLELYEVEIVNKRGNYVDTAIRAKAKKGLFSFPVIVDGDPAKLTALSRLTGVPVRGREEDDAKKV